MGKFVFSIPAKPLMGKYNCTFHDSQGIFISFTRRCAARKGNIPSPFFKMTGLGQWDLKDIISCIYVTVEKLTALKIITIEKLTAVRSSINFAILNCYRETNGTT